jgi:hypothetical protein
VSGSSLLYGSLGDELSAMQRGRIRDLELRTLLTSGIDAAAATEVVTPQPRTSPQYVMDLFPTPGPTSSVMQFVREVNVTTNEEGATSVPENTPKVEQTFEFSAVEDRPVFTSAWVPMTNEIVADAPTLDLYIRTSLVHRLRYRQSRQALYGTGSADDQLNGILTDDDHQTSTASTTEEAVTTALGLVESTGGGAVADGLVIDPTAYWASVEANPSLWRELRDAGVRVIRTTAIATDTVLAGAWRIGSTLREDLISVEVGDQHSDWLIRNKLALRAEQRMQTGWTTPDLFAEVTVSA